MTALPGSHKGIVMPPHPVTAVELPLGSSKLRSTGAEILMLNRAMDCFAVKKLLE